MLISKSVKYLSTEQFFDLFQQLIRESSKGKRLQKDGRRIRSNTLDNYIYTQKLLLSYTIDTGNELRLYLVNHLSSAEKEQAKKYYKKFFSAFCDYLYFEKDFYDNYVGLIIKSIRTFFNYLNTEKNLNVGDYHKQFYVPSEEIPIVVLSPEQLNYLIYDKALEDRLPGHLRTLKDLFVFGCTVALRISDLMQLKAENLHYYNQAHYLKVTSQKTAAHTTIKLPEYAMAILQKYHQQQKTLLPTYTKGYLNRGFKELAKHLDFKEPLIKYRSKRGMKHAVYKNKSKKLHYTLADHITTHTMRRTAITTMLRLGMPDQVVRKISGHAANSKEFFRYVEFAQSYLDEHTDKIFEKITQMIPAKTAFS